MLTRKEIDEALAIYRRQMLPPMIRGDAWCSYEILIENLLYWRRRWAKAIEATTNPHPGFQEWSDARKILSEPKP